MIAYLASKIPGIRARIALVAIALLAPMAILSVYLAERNRAREYEHHHVRAMSIARVLAIKQAELFDILKLQHQNFLNDPNNRNKILAGSDCINKLQLLRQLQPMYKHAAVSDLFGGIACSSVPLKAAINIRDRQYFRQALLENRFVVSNALRSRGNDGEWTIVAASPVIGVSGDPHGVLVATLDLDWTQRILAGMHLPIDSVISLVDSKGTIISRTPEPDKYIGKSLNEAEHFRRVIATNHDGYEYSSGLDGIARNIAYAQVPGYPIYVRVGIPNAAINAAGLDTLRAGMLAIAASLAIALLVGWVGARRLLLDPMKRLADAAARLGIGDLSARTGISHDDRLVGHLATKLDELASHSQRVTRALRALSAGNRTLLRESDEQALLDAMCRVAVEKAGYPLVFVNYAQHDDQKSVVTVARFGRNRGFIEQLQLTWEDSERGRGTVGTAIRTGRPCVLRSTTTDPRFAPWRESAVEHSFGSVISLPLKVDGAVIGTITLLAPEEDAFGDDEVVLLDEMAADLSFGIGVIRERLRHEEAERRHAQALTHDNLTGLPNRASLIESLGQAIADAGDKRTVAVVNVTLPRLQQIFDGFGHEPGNNVVREIARRLEALPGLASRPARLPLEHFCLLLPDGDAQSASRMARVLLMAFEQPVQVGDMQIDMQAAVGASYYPGHGSDPDTLLQRAKIAARDAVHKDIGFMGYNGSPDRESTDRFALAVDLRIAIDQRVLVPHYQPKFDLATGALCACEALVRWPHATRGMIAPAQFVQIAEETGLIRQLTYLMLGAAVRQVREWMVGDRRVPIAVNLSARNLEDPQLIEIIQGHLDSWGVPGDLLEFEITESALVDDPDAARNVLNRLRELGSKIYIDDFGTGYSSLSYLVSLPVHALKIDRSFVRQMAESSQAHAVVASVISMSHKLGLRVVAEGVETEADVVALREMGCDEAQGYRYGKPVTGAEFTEKWLS